MNNPNFYGSKLVVTQPRKGRGKYNLKQILDIIKDKAIKKPRQAHKLDIKWVEYCLNKGNKKTYNLYRKDFKSNSDNVNTKNGREKVLYRCPIIDWT